MSSEYQEHEWSTVCDWCHMEVVSFVGPPHMAEITTQIHFDMPPSTDRVCLMCYADLIKFIAARPVDMARTPQSEG